ncbi:conserved hypothetical protein [Ktedonobacter racemifer DSM 44963]|uniref:Uncharacterized protein n=1 Tax=Ktedonobacter racemifer DSM 44963 TaxID=485913 RepID=D6TUL9_KTERA|nr:conserved hypothetical protein [Ktedonobacter racemifer DSM 44963]
MARKQARPPAIRQVILEPYQITCRACGAECGWGTTAIGQ